MQRPASFKIVVNKKPDGSKFSETYLGRQKSAGAIKAGTGFLRKNQNTPVGNSNKMVQIATRQALVNAFPPMTLQTPSNISHSEYTNDSASIQSVIHKDKKRRSIREDHAPGDSIEGSIPLMNGSVTNNSERNEDESTLYSDRNTNHLILPNRNETRRCSIPNQKERACRKIHNAKQSKAAHASNKNSNSVKNGCKNKNNPGIYGSPSVLNHGNKMNHIIHVPHANNNPTINSHLKNMQMNNYNDTFSKTSKLEEISKNRSINKLQFVSQKNTKFITHKGKNNRNSIIIQRKLGDNNIMELPLTSKNIYDSIYIPQINIRNIMNNTLFDQDNEPEQYANPASNSDQFAVGSVPIGDSKKKDASNNSVNGISVLNSFSNVKVAIRIRPIPEPEHSIVSIFNKKYVLIEKENEKESYLLSQKKKTSTYVFDVVFDVNASQEEVFVETAKPLIPHVLKGINCTVFAYGATGSGKTYTMLDDKNQNGIVQLSILELFTIIKEQNYRNVKVLMSFLEVYNETIRDLLDTEKKKGLEVQEDVAEVRVNNLCEVEVKSYEQAMTLITEGVKNRKMSPTRENKVSSRSHAILQIYVLNEFLDSNMNLVNYKAKLCFVDLAGSERASATSNKGERFKEGSFINQSLLALANCINSLASNRSMSKVRVKYRDSKLTHLLKNSLEGNCLVVMIANINPSRKCFQESNNTLKYAFRARNIKLCATAQTSENKETDLEKILKKNENLQREYDILLGKYNTLKDAFFEFKRLFEIYKNTLVCYQEKEKSLDNLHILEMKQKICMFEQYIKVTLEESMKTLSNLNNTEDYNFVQLLGSILNQNSSMCVNSPMNVLNDIQHKVLSENKIFNLGGNSAVAGGNLSIYGGTNQMNENKNVKNNISPISNINLNPQNECISISLNGTSIGDLSKGGTKIMDVKKGNWRNNQINMQNMNDTGFSVNMKNPLSQTNENDSGVKTSNRQKYKKEEKEMKNKKQQHLMENISNDSTVVDPSNEALIGGISIQGMANEPKEKCTYPSKSSSFDNKNYESVMNVKKQKDSTRAAVKKREPIVVSANVTNKGSIHTEEIEKKTNSMEVLEEVSSQVHITQSVDIENKQNKLDIIEEEHTGNIKIDDQGNENEIEVVEPSENHTTQNVTCESVLNENKSNDLINTNNYSIEERDDRNLTKYYDAHEYAGEGNDSESKGQQSIDNSSSSDQIKNNIVRKKSSILLETKEYSNENKRKYESSEENNKYEHNEESLSKVKKKRAKNKT